MLTKLDIKLSNVLSHLDHELTSSHPLIQSIVPLTHDVTVSDGSTVTITLQTGLSDLPGDPTDVTRWKNVRYKLIDFGTCASPAACSCLTESWKLMSA